MRLLEDSGGIKAVATMRAVSKAWHGFFAAYPAQFASFVVKEPNDLSKLVKIMPSVTSLELSATCKDPDLRPLAACTQLRSLSIQVTAQASATQPETIHPIYTIDLSCLPPSLSSLTVKQVDARLLVSKSVNLPKLSRVCWNALRVDYTEVCSALQRLPELKVAALCCRSNELDSSPENMRVLS